MERLDQQFYPIGANDVKQVTLTPEILGRHLGDLAEDLYPYQGRETRGMVSEDKLWANLYMEAERSGSLSKFDPETLRQKYINWCTKFKEVEPASHPDEDAIVLLMGIPAVTEEKSDKLMKLIRNLFEKAFATTTVFIKDRVNPDKLTPTLIPDPAKAPKEGEEGTQGYLPAAFIACDTPAVASQVVTLLDGLKVGKTKTTTCLLSMVAELAQEPSDFEDPSPKDTIPMNGLSDYLDDTMGREQFAVAYNNKQASLYWNDPVVNTPQEIQDITCGNAAWSTNGSFLLTTHNRGVKVRGGRDMDEYCALPHNEVWKILNSPNERFLISWDGMSNFDGSAQSVKIWDLFTGGRLITTHWCPPKAANGSEIWPFFTFSSCSQYLACNDGSGIIFLSAADGFQPLKDDEGQVYRIPIKNEAASFSWSPSEPILAMWNPPANYSGKTGHGDGPCSCTIIDVSKRSVLATKSLNVEMEGTVLMKWQAQGKYLAMMIPVQLKKSKKARVRQAQIEVFHIRLSGIPTDSFKLDTDKQKIHDIALEPRGDRLAVLQSETLSIYLIHRDASKAETRLVASRNLGPMSRVNSVHWSPHGSFFCLAGIDSGDGPLSFNALNKTAKGELKIDETHNDNHFSINDVQWDPSGRFLASIVKVEDTQTPDFSKAAESSYRIWTFQGRELTHQKSHDRALINFQWRSHPMGVLSDEKVEEIQNNIATFHSKFANNDDAARKAALDEQEQEKMTLVHKFDSALKEAQATLHGETLYKNWELSRMEELEEVPLEQTQVEVTTFISSEIEVKKPTAV